MRPLINTIPPGPKARQVLLRDRKVISQSMAREYPLVVDHAEGVNVWDIDGNRYLDMNSFIAVMNFGHSHPKITAAIKAQLEKMTHAGFLDFYADLPVRFAERLLKHLPKGFSKVYFSNSGAESIEAAMKLARHHTKRKYFISFYGGFHGRTYGALSLTSAKTIHRKHFGPFLSVIHAPYPNPYRCPVGSNANTCDVDTLRYIEEEIFATEADPEEVAAVFVEPVQGESGYIVPPQNFLKKLRKLCSDNGILLVADEVQSGVYRTGKFLAMEHFGVKPDIVCLSKSIGGGLPFGVTASTDEVMTWPRGSHASTFGGNLAACSAAMAVLDIIEEDKSLGKEVERKGRRIQNFLKKLQKKHEIIGDVRGLGLMIGMELVEDRQTKNPAKEKRNRILEECFRKGLLLLPAGQSVIRFSPPLIIADEDMDAGLGILEDVMGKY